MAAACGAECVRVRVKDVDFAQHILLVQDGKGEKDRITMLPETLVAPLQEHLVRVKQLHTTDLVEGYGAVYLRVRAGAQISQRQS